jgi:hypothetical protein
MKKLILITILLSFSMVCAAEGIVQCSTTTCTWEDLSVSLSNLIKTGVIFSFWTAFLLVVIGAFLVMFGGPKPDLIQQGKTMIRIAIFGYALILFSGILFDIILEVFQPKFKNPSQSYFGPKIVLAQTATLKPGTFYKPLSSSTLASLKCGENAEPLFGSQSLGRLFQCFFDVLNLLKNITLVLLAFAIIASAGYLITTPLFGFKQISRAYKILIWSTIGLIVILLADVIKDQITNLLKT